MDGRQMIEALEDIKKLPPDVHIFCPREKDDEHDTYEEDEGDITQIKDESRRAQISRAQDRRKAFIQCTQLLAFDGEDSLPYQKAIYRLLEINLKRCDTCVRRYYLERVSFAIQLRQDYAEPEIQDFLSILDRRDIARIQEGLTNARNTLKPIPESKRGVGSLEYSDLVSLFEAFHCRRFHEDEKLLAQYFDEPFKLIQTKRPLKLPDILPATTFFLFDANQDRLSWAVGSWNRLSRPPTELEWDYAVKETLQSKIDACNHPSSSLKLWSALNVITSKLDHDSIAHKLFDLKPPFYKLTLDHLAQPTFSIPSIAQTLVSVLQKAPEIFWQSMGSISSKQLVESLFGSPRFDRCLENALEENAAPALDVLTWVDPFLKSLKAEERPSACRTLVDQLFRRSRGDTLSKNARVKCLDVAVKAMQYTITTFSTDRACRVSTSKLVLSDALDIMSSHIDELLHPEDGLCTDEIRNDIMSIIRNSLALECECLKTDFENLTSWKPLPPHALSSYTSRLWEVVTKSLRVNDTTLSKAVLVGITPLTGLDEINMRERQHGSHNAKDLAKMKSAFDQFSTYNAVFRNINVMVSKIFEQLSTFDPDHFDDLFKEQQTSMVLFAALFSGNEAIYQASVDIIKAISGTYGRKEALSHLFQAFFGTSLYSVDWVFRRISIMRTFGSVPRMLRLGQDILDLLCDSSGIMRGQKLDMRSYNAVQSYWSYQWSALQTCFRCTEQWSLEQRDKGLMLEVCRDTMQYAEQLFQHYHLFLSVLDQAMPENAKEHPRILLDTNDASASFSPPKCLYPMSTWLRLRDQYLADTLVNLITNMIGRLKEYGVAVSEENFHYVFAVVIPGFEDVKKKQKNVKTILSKQQKAELIRALEAYLDRTLIEHPTIKRQAKINNWTVAEDRSGQSTPTREAIDLDEYKFDDDDIKDSDLYALSEQHEAIQKAKKTGTERQALKPSRPLPFTPKPLPQPPSLQEQLARQGSVSKAFIEKRKQEQAAQKARQREAALRLRGEVGVGQHTAGAGSGLKGIGVQGKDHTKERSEIMMSSESEGDSGSDDDELFGKMPKAQAGVRGVVRKPIATGPVRKVKQVRSQKDIRARLTPDLSGLHKEILSWDFFADTDTPPTSSKTDYTLVTNTFRSAQDYISTFQPLLVLEGWQSFRAAREDNSFSTFELKVASSLIVDNFFEVTTVLPMAEGKERRLMASEVILLSTGKRPHDDKDQPHCLARCKEVNRKKGEMHVVYRVNAANNPMRQFLNDKTTVYAVQILSLTPLEREYSALMALEYYDLCDEIIRAKPSPLLNYNESELSGIKKIYNVNLAQAKAVRSALDNDAFTLVQGPPGSGKTKTICAIVGAILTGYLHKSAAPRIQPTGKIVTPPSGKKILVCAPSNAAVDELVMRFKQGVMTMDGREETINVVRLGKSDSINTNVRDVTLEELVNAKLNTAAPKDAKQDIGSVMMEHKKASEEFREQIQKLDQLRSKGTAPSVEDERLVENLKRQKAILGNKIDDMRRDENVASREADVNRKRMQQEVLDSAHVLCATLSGSGHEIFQSLNVEFETVIIDEAAQSIELSALIPLKYGCNKCILVGDPKQLPPTVLSRQAAKFQYEQSLFARMEGNHKKDIHLLDTQYRMHPDISMFPSRMFYDSRLKDGDGMAKLRARPWHHSQVLAPYRFFDVQGLSKSASTGHSLINVAELNVAMQLYERLITDVPQYNFKGKIGIITPYKGQLKELKARFRNRYGENILSDIDFNTTDAFQGRESEIIIFSCVRANTSGLGFLNDIRRMNVGLTRAKCSLWVLGNSEALVKGEYWRGLVNDAKSRDRYTDGDVLSLLRRPLLTADMMKDDVAMDDTAPSPLSISRTTSATSSVPYSKESTPASIGSHVRVKVEPDINPARRSSSALISSHPTKEETLIGRQAIVLEKKPAKLPVPGAATSVSSRPSKEPPRPLDGDSGLDAVASCIKCGSKKHSSHECDNEGTRAASLEDCFRCRKSGHTSNFCQEPRCIACGALGHLEESCTMPASKRLDSNRRQAVKQQEADFVKKQQVARERRAEKRLGEHAARIPMVKNTAGPDIDHKRKRSEDTKGPAPRAPKAMRPDGAINSEAAANGHSKQSGNSNGIRPPGTNGRPPAGPAPQMIKRRKPTTDNLFVKRK